VERNLGMAAAHVEVGKEALPENFDRVDTAEHRRDEEDETPTKRQRINIAVTPISTAAPVCLCGSCGKSSTCAKSTAVATTPAIQKRESYLDWDSYFMSLAFLSAMRSKDPSTQVGACIVDAANKIMGIGYNGFPHNCSDDDLPWAREAPDWLDTKYPYVCNAELNAILNKNASDLRGCRIYVANFPQNESSKLIVQSGIKEVVYLGDKHKHTPTIIASRRILELAGVSIRQFSPASSKLVIDFDSIN
jgi:dCMP deaminase